MQRVQVLEQALAVAEALADDHAKQVDHPLARLRVRESLGVRRCHAGSAAARLRIGFC